MAGASFDILLRQVIQTLVEKANTAPITETTAALTDQITKMQEFGRITPEQATQYKGYINALAEGVKVIRGSSDASAAATKRSMEEVETEGQKVKTIEHSTSAYHKKAGVLDKIVESQEKVIQIYNASGEVVSTNIAKIKEETKVLEEKDKKSAESAKATLSSWKPVYANLWRARKNLDEAERAGLTRTAKEYDSFIKKIQALDQQRTVQAKSSSDIRTAIDRTAKRIQSAQEKNLYEEVIRFTKLKERLEARLAETRKKETEGASKHQRGLLISELKAAETAEEIKQSLVRVTAEMAIAQKRGETDAYNQFEKAQTALKIKQERQKRGAAKQTQAAMYRNRLEMDRVARQINRAGLVIVAAFAGMIREAARTSVEMMRLQAVTGETYSELSRLTGIMGAFGVKSQSLLNALAGISKALLTAAEGTSLVAERVKEVFASVGIEAKRMHERHEPVIETLFKIRKAYQELEDPATRAYLAHRVFGSSSEQMQPFLEANEETFERLLGVYRSLPGFTRQAIDGMRDMNVELEAMKLAGRSFALEMARGVRPVVSGVMNLFGRIAFAARGVKEEMDGWFKAVSSGILVLGALLMTIGTVMRAFTIYDRVIKMVRESKALLAIVTWKNTVAEKAHAAMTAKAAAMVGVKSVAVKKLTLAMVGLKVITISVAALLAKVALPVVAFGLLIRKMFRTAEATGEVATAFDRLNDEVERFLRMRLPAEMRHVEQSVLQISREMFGVESIIAKTSAELNVWGRVWDDVVDIWKKWHPHIILAYNAIVGVRDAWRDVMGRAQAPDMPEMADMRKELEVYLEKINVLDERQIRVAKNLIDNRLALLAAQGKDVDARIEAARYAEILLRRKREAVAAQIQLNDAIKDFSLLEQEISVLEAKGTLSLTEKLNLLNRVTNASAEYTKNTAKEVKLADKKVALWEKLKEGSIDQIQFDKEFLIINEDINNLQKERIKIIEKNRENEHFYLLDTRASQEIAKQNVEIERQRLVQTAQIYRQSRQITEEARRQTGEYANLNSAAKKLLGLMKEMRDVWGGSHREIEESTKLLKEQQEVIFFERLELMEKWIEADLNAEAERIRRREELSRDDFLNLKRIESMKFDVVRGRNRRQAQMELDEIRRVFNEEMRTRDRALALHRGRRDQMLSLTRELTAEEMQLLVESNDKIKELEESKFLFSKHFTDEALVVKAQAYREERRLARANARELEAIEKEHREKMRAEESQRFADIKKLREMWFAERKLPLDPSELEELLGFPNKQIAEREMKQFLMMYATLMRGAEKELAAMTPMERIFAMPEFKQMSDEMTEYMRIYKREADRVGVRFDARFTKPLKEAETVAQGISHLFAKEFPDGAEIGISTFKRLLDGIVEIPQTFKQILLEGKKFADETGEEAESATESTLRTLEREYGAFQRGVRSFLQGSIDDWGAYGDGIVEQIRRALATAREELDKFTRETGVSLRSMRGGFQPAGLSGSVQGASMGVQRGLQGYEIKPLVEIHTEHKWDVKTMVDVHEIARQVERTLALKAVKTRQGLPRMA